MRCTASRLHTIYPWEFIIPVVECCVLFSCVLVMNDRSGCDVDTAENKSDFGGGDTASATLTRTSMSPDLAPRDLKESILVSALHLALQYITDAMHCVAVVEG